MITKVPILSFGLLFEQTQLAGMIILDENGIILDSNNGIRNAFGYTRDDLAGKYFSLLFTEEDRSVNLPEIELASVKQKGTMTDINYIVHKDGSRLWTHGESIITKDTTGKTFIVKIIFDIQKQKLLEEHLKKANEELLAKNESLSHINRDLDTFVYTASHDLKAPISNIQALLSSLSEEMSEESRRSVDEILNMLQESVDKFQETLKNLTQIAKSKSDQEEEEVFFEEMVETVKNNLDDKIISSGISLHCDFSKAPSIRFSRKNLQSVMFNLISNAVKYRDPQRKPEIDIATQREDGYMVLKVKDNGLGIREEDKGRIFNMYERFHEHVEGTGVGMNIVKRIIDNNGGKIDVETEVGKGTTFRVYFKV